jgi:hypothetical protein
LGIFTSTKPIRQLAAGLNLKKQPVLEAMIGLTDKKSPFAIWTETALPGTTHSLERVFQIPPYRFLLLANF